ncbi:gliding motility-associated ABC transporter permease subunit GldF [soil metagenome]
MYPIFKKEISQFFSSLTSHLAMGVFLLIMGLFLFIFPETSILDYGYATLDKFFELAPYILLLLVPAITMRSFSDEIKSGTWELLKTKPVSLSQIIGGKYFAALAIALLSIVPTFVYVFTIRTLSINGSIDGGGIAGAYIGLIFLIALFTAIGICCSALSSNSVVAFLLSAFVCFLIYMGFSAVSRIPALQGGADYWIENLGADIHYQNMSRGLIEIKDLLFFFIISLLFLLVTKKLVMKK